MWDRKWKRKMFGDARGNLHKRQDPVCKFHASKELFNKWASLLDFEALPNEILDENPLI
jgi:hypothetical protein